MRISDTRAISRRTFLRGTCATTAGLVFPGIAGPLLMGDDGEPEVVFPSPDEMNGIIGRALARGGDYADLFLEHTIETRISMVDGEIGSIGYGVAQGGGLRTVHGERTGYAYAESVDPAQLVDAARTSASIASGTATDWRKLQERQYARYVNAEIALQDASMADKVALVERMDRAARAVDPSIRQAQISYTDSVRRMAIATSTGDLVYDELPVIYLRINVNAERNGHRAMGMYRNSARMGMEFVAGDLPERAGREASEQAIRMLDAVPAPTGELPVVVAAGGGVMFHEAVGHGLEADGVLRDISVFAGRMGQKVASDLVTLYDDATIPGARGSFNVDDEATPSERTLLIERGKLAGFMHDRRTARLMGTKSTGNGRRESFRHPVLVRMTNTNLAPGEDDPEEIIRETKRGVYAAHFGGGQVNTATGQFTFGLREAYLIEEGKITAPIREANLVGSGIEVLERIDRVGSDFDAWPGTCGKGQWVPVTSGCPTLRISRITVGGTGGAS